MTRYSVTRSLERRFKETEKAAAVCGMFGITSRQLCGGWLMPAAEKGITHSCTLEINDGDIVYITGPSGSGKSLLLNELEKSVPFQDKINLAQIELAADRPLIDCIEGDLVNDVYCIIERPVNLSEGQKYRFRLARALSAGKKFIFADEFCSNLDRISASVIAHNVQRFAKRHKVAFVLASAAEDILGDLRPDVLVVKELSGATEVVYKKNDPQVSPQGTNGAGPSSFHYEGQAKKRQKATESDA
jgi:ABC-type ATPase involved in cell division